MAIIKTSGLITDINGSIQGSTFQNSLGGLTLKSKSFQKRRFSEQANAAKSIMNNLQEEWKNLSQANRDLWNAFALFKPTLMNNGSGRLLNGQQLFLKYGAWYYSQFLFVPNLPAMSNTYLAPVAVSVVYNAPNLEIHTDRNINEASEFINFRISSPMLQSQKSPKGGSKQIVLTFGNTQIVDVTTEYLNLYGIIPTAGEYVFIEWRLCSVASGFYSNLTSEKVVIL